MEIYGHPKKYGSIKVNAPCIHFSTQIVNIYFTALLKLKRKYKVYLHSKKSLIS